MATATRRGALAVVVAILLIALGAGAGFAVGDALGIRSEAAEVLEPRTGTPAPVAAPVAPPEFASVDAPDTERMGVALDALREAGASVDPVSPGPTLSVTAGTGDAADDTYLLTGAPAALRIEAVSEAGAVRGVYDLAAQVRAGRDIAEHLGVEMRSRLPLRMADLGAVGVASDPAQWRPGTDYSHASRAFADVLRPEAPYVDEDALAAAYDDFETFLRRSLADGFTAIAFPGFVEFVTFDDAPVYADGDRHRQRALALREAFGRMWERADELGVDVYLRTDMLALTDPLEAYLTERFGSLETTSPEFWDVYGRGLDELYAAEPALDGVLVRIGEAGDVYDVEGWDAYSKLAVTDADSVRAMLTALTAQAEASGREVIFRSWSVGVGAVGDMHTDADSYREVLDGIDSPALIVSTKYTLGDFYSWLPLNDTLLEGTQRRIVEFQSRREFENFGAFPNDLGPEYQEALQTLLAGNDRIEGVWVWTQDGGPWRAGPMSLHLKVGEWQFAQLNTQLALALARDPDADVAEVTQDWAREFFSTDPVTVEAITAAMALSREPIAQGMYIEPFARQRVLAIGLEPPPMMWLFEWDILTGDSAVLDVLYTLVKDDAEAAMQGGADAVTTAERMRDLVAATDPSTWRSPHAREAFVETLDYEVDTLRVLGAYRAVILAQGEWHDTLDPAAHTAWTQARDAFTALTAAHADRYDGDVQHPPLNLTAAELGIERTDRDLVMAWLARILLALAVAWVVIGMLSARTRLVGRPGAAAARAAWLAATRPWRARESTLGMLPLDRWLLLLVPGALLVATRAVQTSFLGWVHLAVVFGAWLVFVCVVRLILWRRSPWPVIAAVGGVVVLRCILTLAALSFTGPGGYWFAFWTDPVRRTAYIAVAFALFVWVFVAAGWALAAQVGARRATGTVLAGVGAGLALPAAIVGLVGLERALTAWNDQLGLLPWGLSRILGITVYLDIPAWTAWAAAGLGAGILAVGLALASSLRVRLRA
ncbi:hypothetical protein ACTU3I_12590 [Microbacterium sp. RD1]|uniref:hypothetical protein n=1 Tax=Microbacterium sp. RD1 TaxID=3457313 RepID=UPI003FA58319